MTGRSTPSDGRRIFSFADLARQEAQSPREEGQSFYTGGTRSGQMVNDPNQPRDAARPTDGHRIFEDLQRQVEQQGGFDEEEDDEEEDHPTGIRAFTGSGRRLGDPENQAEDPSASSAIATPSVPTRVTRTMTLWQDGFSIDDGPLYRFDDPANQAHLAQIQRGEAPLDLMNAQRGQRVMVQVSRRLEETYAQGQRGTSSSSATPSVTAFTGAGQRLGGVSPSLGNTPVAGSPATSTPATPSMEVDLSAPTTSIQVRLLDGTKLVVKMNHSHTVGDLRRFVQASRPISEMGNFTLQTTFPTRVLSDDSETIAEAKLLNSVVVQKRA